MRHHHYRHHRYRRRRRRRTLKLKLVDQAVSSIKPNDSSGQMDGAQDVTCGPVGNNEGFLGGLEQFTGVFRATGLPRCPMKARWVVQRVDQGGLDLSRQAAAAAPAGLVFFKPFLAFTLCEGALMMVESIKAC